ncbi:MAG: Ig-like domain-containing protein [Acidobacteriota bacterium]
MKTPHLASLVFFAAVASLLASEHGTRPVARPDSATTDAATPITIDPLANDSDADGEVLTVTVTGGTCPGTASANGDGTVHYDPQGGSSDGCQIHYRLTDEGGRFDTASVEVVVASGGGSSPSPVTTDPLDPRRLIRDGRSLFVAGYYPGLHSLSSLHRPLYNEGQPYHQALLDELASHDLNLTRAFLTLNMALEASSSAALLPYQRSDQCCTADGSELGLNRKKFDLDRFDESFFDYWEDVVRYADERGIVMVLAFFDASHVNDWEFNWTSHNGHHYKGGRKYDFFSRGNNANGVPAGVDPMGGNPAQASIWYTDPKVRTYQDRFVRRVVRQLGGYGNIIWEVANEPAKNRPWVRTWREEIRDVIRNVEQDEGYARHLVMPLDLPDHSNVEGHWLPGDSSANSGCTGGIETCNPRDLYVQIQAALADQFAGESRPLLADNDCCTYNGTTKNRRQKAWLSLLSGAYPLVFEFAADESEETLFEAGSRDAMRWTGYTRTLVESRAIDLVGMEPFQGLTGLDSERPVWALARPGSEYLLYFFRAGSATVPDLPAEYRAEWFDPRTGAFESAGRGPTFSRSGTQDWVLYIATDSDLAVPRIDQHPQPMVVPPGGTAFLEVTASVPSGAPLAYRWMKDDRDLVDGGSFSGAGTRRLAIGDADSTVIGEYRCRVTNAVSGDAVTSHAAALTLTAGTGGVVDDTFTLNGSDRRPGVRLDGTLTEVGARPWSATAGVVLAADGAVTNSGDPATSPQDQGGVSFDPLAFPDRPVTQVEARVSLDGAAWVGIGLASQPTGGYWTVGQVWMLLRASGRVDVYAAGNQHRLLAVAAPGFAATEANHLKLAYDTAERRVYAWVNGVLVLAGVELPAAVNPTLRYAGFHLNAVDEPVSGRLRLDDFHVEAGDSIVLSQTPYATHAVPGSVIEAEHFDRGGPGIAYLDDTPGNQAATPFRPEEWVDAGGAGPVAVERTVAGEWLEYTIDVTHDATFDLSLRYLHPGTVPGRVRYEIGTAQGTLDLPGTGGTWSEAEASGLALSGGDAQVLRLTFDDGCCRFDSLTLVEVVEPPQFPYPAGSGPHSLPGRLQVEDFDLVEVPEGGEGWTFHDTTPGNSFGDYRSDGPDLNTLGIPGTDEYLQTVLSSTRPGEWLEYTVDIAEGGSYDLIVHYSTTTSGVPGTLSFQIEDAGVDAAILLPSTSPAPGTAGSWEVVVKPEVVLPAGEQVVRLYLDDASYNLNWVEVWPHVEEAPVAQPEVLVPISFDPVNAAYDIPAGDLLANDTPAGRVELSSVELWGQYGNARITDTGDVRFHVNNPAFWSGRLGSFEYTIRHRDNPHLTASATASLVPEGPLADDDYIVIGTDRVEDISFAEVLGDDLPTGLTAVRRAVPGSGPFHGTLTGTAQGWRYTHTRPGPFPEEGDRFSYEIELAGNPQATARATVHLFENNPVQARDDFGPVPWGGTYPVEFAWLLSNDDAPGPLTVEDRLPSDYDPSFGSLSFQAGPLWGFEPAPPFWDQPGASFEFTYAAVLDQELTDSAAVRLVPSPTAQDDVVKVPFDPDREVLRIPNAYLLPNDGPPGRIQVVASDEAATRTAARDDGVIEFFPNADFWTSRRATLHYEIYLDTSPERLDRGEVTLIATNGVEARPDLYRVPPGVVDHFFIPSGHLSGQIGHVLANDEPPGLVRAVGGAPQFVETDCGRVLPWYAGDGSFGGWQYQPEEAFYTGCAPDSFAYTAELDPMPGQQADGTSASGTIWLFAGPVPPILAAPDEIPTYEDLPVAIPFGDLLANDSGEALIVALQPGGPEHGHVELQPASVVYQPQPGFVGTDRFSYVVRDRFGRVSDPATVTITVDASPVAAGPDVFLVPEGALSFDLPSAALLDDDRPVGELFLDGWSDPQWGRINPRGSGLSIRYVPDPAFWTAGVDTFDYTAAWHEHPTLTASAEVTLEAEAACVEILSDDFESTLAGWTQVVASGGQVTTSPAAALAGSAGLEVALQPGAQGVFLHDASPERETHFQSRFLFDPSALTMKRGAEHPVLTGGQGGYGVVVSLALRKSTEGYELVLAVRSDAGVWEARSAPIFDQRQRIHLEWWAGSGPGASDGGARLWIDHRQALVLAQVDNDLRWIDGVNLGAVYGIEPDVAGSLYFDDFRSCRGARSRSFVQVDDFDSATLDAWAPAVSGGGQVAASSVAAVEGSHGLAVAITPGPGIHASTMTPLGSTPTCWAEALLPTTESRAATRSMTTARGARRRRAMKARTY